MSFWKRWFPGARPPAAPPPVPATPPAFPYPLVAAPGADAVATWHRLREAWRAEGRCPILLGDAERVEGMAEALRLDPEPPEAILARAATLDPQAFFDARLAEALETYGELPLGEWEEPPAPPRLALTAHTDILTGMPRPTVWFAAIPTVNTWEVPAYLRYGNWNSCPAPEAQVAVHRRWHERHGSELYAVAGDVVECLVARPPPDRAGAERLAQEQFLYCDDIVVQGTETLARLAASLRAAPGWFFWWD
jgi:hypothetical protein